MKRNRRVKKRSRFATSSMGVASLIISGFIMMMIFFTVNSRCSSITREIGDREHELQRLNAELAREKTRWDEMKVTERLNVALTRFGLEMAAPREDQIVRMNRAGQPAPGQLALKRTLGVSRTRAVAANTPRVKAATAVSRRRGRNGLRK